MRSAREADEIEGRSRTLTPGLIDCHVHLCFDGSADFAGEIGRASCRERVLRLV